MKKLHIRTIFIIFTLIIFYGCEKNLSPLENAPAVQRGDIVESRTLKIYTPDDINQILVSNGTPFNFPLTDTVEAVHLSYQTEDFHGNSITASGAIIVPKGGRSYPLLSIHHGTITKRDQVASVQVLNLAEGVIGLIMGSIGYATCLPDYPGFGVSETLHPYIHAKSLSIAVIDFLRAAKTYCAENNISLNEQLFLTGYSEGGYVTMATHKEIEANYADEFSLTAVAPMAGPYDIVNMFETIAQSPTYKEPANMAFFMTAYNHVYGWNRLSEIFNAPFGQRMDTLFDGTKDFGEVTSQLSANVPELFNQDVIDAYFAGNEPEIARRLEENSLLDWSPVAPIRMFHGDADQTVFYQNALTALDRLTANGAISIELITIPGGTHATAAVPGFLGTLGWFETFRNPGGVIAANPSSPRFDWNAQKNRRDFGHLGGLGL